MVGTLHFQRARICDAITAVAAMTVVLLAAACGQGGSPLGSNPGAPSGNRSPLFQNVPPPVAAVGVLYTWQASAFDEDGDALAFTLTASPPGMTSTSNGLVAWTPVAGEEGQHGISLSVSDGKSSVSRDWTLTVGNAPTLTSASPIGSASAGNAYDHLVTISGAPWPAVTVVVSPPLDSWLAYSIGTISGGVIMHGTPLVTDIGTSGTVTVTATNPFGTADYTVTIDVQGSPVITSAIPPSDALVWQLYEHAITATGSQPLDIQAAISPALDTWLDFIPATSSSPAMLRGTPFPNDTAATGTVTITVGNALGQTVQQCDIEVFRAPELAGIADTSVTVGQNASGPDYRYLVSRIGWPSPTFSVTGLPSNGWLTFDPASGSFAGEPSYSDMGPTGTIRVTADNGIGLAAIQDFVIEVNVNPFVDFFDPAMSTANADQLYEHQIAVVGWPVPEVTVTGLRPGEWLTFNDSNNTFHGTPGRDDDTGVYGQVKVVARNTIEGVVKTHNRTFTLTVTADPRIDSTAVTDAYVDGLYEYHIEPSGWPAPDDIQVVIPAGSEWLHFNEEANTLYGTPGAASAGVVVPITVTASNGSQTATQVFDISVAVHPDEAPAIVSTAPLTAYHEGGYVYPLTLTGWPSPHVVASYQPPVGWLEFDDQSNMLIGAPPGDAVGSSVAVSLTATNDFGSDTQEFTIEVLYAPDAAPTIRSSTSTPSAPIPTSAAIGQLYECPIIVDGWPVPDVSVTGYETSGWLAFDDTTMLLSGTPRWEHIGAAIPIVVTATNALGGDSLQFAITVAASWSTEIVDGQGPHVGRFSSLALDGNGKVHVAYYDSTNKNLKFATNVTGAWNVEPVPVDAAGDAGTFVSLALDSSGTAHVAYVVHDDGEHSRLAYATNAGGTWYTDTVDHANDESGAAGHASLALHGGQVHIAYQAGRQLRYAVKVESAGSGWSIHQVDTGDGSNVGAYASLALDTGGFAHVAYVDGTHGALKYATNAGAGPVPQGEWFVETVDSDGEAAGTDVSLTLDALDHVHLAYGRWTTATSGLQLIYATNGSGTWEIVPAGSITLYGDNPGIAIVWPHAGATSPGVFFLRSSSSGVKIHWASYTAGSGWTVEPVQAVSEVGAMSPSSGLGGGRLHLVWHSPTYQTLKYSSTSGAPGSGPWSAVEVIDGIEFPDQAGEFVSLALDSNGNAHVAYLSANGDASVAANHNLKYATNAGVGWVPQGEWFTETVDDAGKVGMYASLKLDTAGKVHIAYYDATNQDLKYATNATPSGDWDRTVVDAANDAGAYASLAVDNNGRVHIAYYDATNQALKYAANVSGAWVVEAALVDGGNGVDAGQYASIAALDESNVHIAYYDKTNKDLKYARRNPFVLLGAAPWILRTIDSLSGSLSVGRHTSIALDASGNASVAYSANVNGSPFSAHFVKYAYQVGSSWHSKVISSSASTNYDARPSLAISSGNKATIAFRLAGKVKLAWQMSANPWETWHELSLPGGNLGSVASAAIGGVALSLNNEDGVRIARFAPSTKKLEFLKNN